jgi:hypothetical protein
MLCMLRGSFQSLTEYRAMLRDALYALRLPLEPTKHRAVSRNLVSLAPTLSSSD